VSKQWWGVAVLSAIAMGACARGAPEPGVLSQGIAGDAGPPVVTATAPETAPASDATHAPVDGGVTDQPAGEPCARGEVRPCPCPGLAAEGERRCLFDADSPLDGFFSDCGRCAEPDTGPAGSAGAGASGMAGDATDAGNPTGGAGDPGDMADADSPTGDGGGATAPEPPPGSAQGCLADQSMCSGLLQCCRPDGLCGLGADGVLCL
jgi:hypothetical protein